MNKAAASNLSRLLWLLIVIQLFCCLYVTGKYVLFRSSLQLRFNGNLFQFQKLQLILGSDYQLALNLADVQQDAGILAVSSNDLWFLNYYLLPRRLYNYPGITKDEDVKKVPVEFIKEKRIDYVLLYHPPSVKILKVNDNLRYK